MKSLVSVFTSCTLLFAASQFCLFDKWQNSRTEKKKTFKAFFIVVFLSVRYVLPSTFSETESAPWTEETQESIDAAIWRIY